ncbi:MAG: helix-turn-helix domain-containing protein [Bryobacteraceae bacterium]
MDDVLLEHYECDPGPPVTGARHSHAEYQVCLSLNFPGEYWYRGMRHPVPVGSVTILHPGEVHSTRDPVARDIRSRYAVFYLPQERVREAALGWRGKGGKVNNPFFGEPVILENSTFRTFWRAWLVWNSNTTALERQSAALKALGLAFAAGGFEPPPAPPWTRAREAVRRAREYLEDHFTENISLQRLTELTGLSPYHLAREFRACLGMPPHAYQTQVRIMRAKRLILTGEPLPGVATLVGFADQSHLGRHFRKIIGISPGRYSQSSARTF